MPTVSIEQVCRLCGTRASVEPPGRSVLHPACPRCLMPYLLTHTADADRSESLLLCMYAVSSAVGDGHCPLRRLSEMAPTTEEVERVRGELHGFDIPALVERTRVKEHTTFTDSLAMLPDAIIADLDAELEACLGRLLRDAGSGLLRWRIDHLCRTVCAAIDARAAHHRRLSEAAP